MYTRPLLWILLFIPLTEVLMQTYEYDEYEYDVQEELKPGNCSTEERIRGGNVTYSEWGLPGSVLTFQCGPGQYPHPVSYRLCGSDGEWSPMRTTNHRLVSQATCKNVLCPAQLELDHGDIWPRGQWFHAGATQSFSCHEGYTLSGSVQRNCTISGMWTGTAPICDNHAEDCDDPGIPPGAQRTAVDFNFGGKVTYLCHAGLDLLGSSERVCLESREWSGSPPRCQSAKTYDSPSDVAAAMSGSLAGVMDVFSPDSIRKETISYGRTINVAEGSRLHIYILLDTSGSIKQNDFNESRNATIALINKLDSYEVQIKYHILSFASETIDIVDITKSDISGSAVDVIHELMTFKYTRHGSKTGTNIFAALQRVNEMISGFKVHRAENSFNETQNIIIIETDGFSNTGKNPVIAVKQIRGLLGYSPHSEEHTHETMLDIYVFGIGDSLNKGQLNTLASKKSGERHVFFLRDFPTLGKVFNSIISDKSVTMCGVAQEEGGDEPVYNKPWHVVVSMAKTAKSFSCFGSIVSQNWVLTAAHCFAKASTEDIPQKVDIQYGFPEHRITVSKRVIVHPQFNTQALRHRNVSEFYDYDIALVQLNKSIPLSWEARPICLPCTVSASRALKSANLTCRQHMDELLPHEETAAYFIRGTKNTRTETLVQTQSRRQGCVENATKTLMEPTDVTIEEYIPDRLLCSKGISQYPNAFSCKGDSGGSLFLQKKKRYFQIGVLSWGTTDVCKQSPREKVPPHTQDFHINLFKILPWLKQHLGQDVQFLPKIDVKP